MDFDAYYNHAGVAVTASTGDTGDVTNWPAANPNVVAVGGTALTQDTTNPRGWNETAWVDGGSGCSPYEPHPDYQNGIDTNCASNRAMADISADADPNTGLAVYDTLGYSGWLQVGGTSLSSPLVASMYALAGTPVPGTYPVSYPYQALGQPALRRHRGQQRRLRQRAVQRRPGLGRPDGSRHAERGGRTDHGPARRHRRAGHGPGDR